MILCGLTYGNNTSLNLNGTVQCYECESVDDKADEMNQGCWILEEEGEPLGDDLGTCLGLRSICDAFDFPDLTKRMIKSRVIKEFEVKNSYFSISVKGTVALYQE